jgi:uncharacterized protein
MVASTARVTTERATTYLKRLCQHFADDGQRHSAQEFEVAFDDREGFINFAPVVTATCRLDARQEGVLMVEVRASDQAARDRVQRIVAKHLERFGQSDGLRVEWGAASERSGTG